MSKTLLSLGGAMFALGLLAYEGPTFTVTAWRGETAYVEVPDNLSGEFEGAYGDWETNEIETIAVDLLGTVATPYTSGDTLSLRFDRVIPLISETGVQAPIGKTICRVAVSAEAQPGVHDFGPLQVKVVDRVLPPPSEWHYYLDLWQHPWAVARAFDVEPFGAEHAEAMAPVMRTLAECGQKVLTTTLVDLPWNHQCYDAYHSMIGRVKKSDGTWVFDYTDFDNYVAYGRKCGIGPDIACYTMCPWGYVVRWQNEKGETERGAAKPGTPAFEDFWGAFLVDFAAHLKAKGWFEHTYLAMDERSPEDVRLISEFVRKKAPGFRISMAGNRKPSDFQGITLDSYSQILADVTPAFLAELDARRAKGYRTTFYVCCWPQRPNTFLTSGGDEAFWLGAFPAFSGFDGFLRWAANCWPADPYGNASFGNWTPGDTFLVYPNGEYSTRLLTLRAGIVAAEKLRLLKEKGLFAADIEKARAACDFKAALGGSLDYGAFRRRVDELVNRADP